MATGIKKSDKSERSLIKALSEQLGYVPDVKDKTLAKIDSSTGSYLCATIEKASDQMLEDASKHFEAESVMYRAQAQATLVESSSKSFSKKGTYSWFASQAIKYYMTHRQG